MGKSIPGFWFHIGVFLDNCIFEPLFIHQCNVLHVELLRELGKVVSFQRFSVLQLSFLSGHIR